MKVRYGKQTWLALAAGLSVLLFGACSESLSAPESPPASGSGALMITAKATAPGTAAENAIRTLRLLVYSVDGGELLVNKLLMTEDALTEIPSGTYTYFAVVNGQYTISEMLPKKAIRAYLVANETRSFDPKPTEEQVRDRQVNLYAIYGTGGTLDIPVIGTDPASNRGYIPMFAQSETMEPYQWAGGGKVVRMEMERTLAKVTVRIKGGAMTDPVFTPGDKISIKSAAIVHIPQYFYLGNSAFSNSASLISTSVQPFATPIEIDGVSESATDQLTFYIPEHIISQAYVDNGQYTYIQVDGEYYSSDAGETIRNVYEIPLGNGVGKLYDAVNPARIEDLTVPDLTVSRNVHYDVEAQVATIGKLEGLQVVVKVLDWDGEEQVNGDVDAPLLNVSSVSVVMINNKTRVSFWTNRSNVYVEPTLKTYHESGYVGNHQANTIFTDISGAPGVSTSKFKLYANGENKYYPYNGYIDLEFINPPTTRSTAGPVDSYEIVLNADGLRRTIQIRPNKETVLYFRTTEGAGVGVFETSIWTSDLGGGNKVYIEDPRAKFTPLPGRVFTGWSTSPNNVPNIPVVGTKLEITLPAATLWACWATI